MSISCVLSIVRTMDIIAVENALQTCSSHVDEVIGRRSISVRPRVSDSILPRAIGSFCDCEIEVRFGNLGEGMSPSWTNARLLGM